MDASVKFSILVPVYNVEKYIRECIDSVLKQGYGNFELVLVDDGSTDTSGLICDEYAAKDERIKVFHKPNGGLMSARRTGIANAAGDYFIFVDSDDFIAENTLEVLAENIAKTGADCIVYGIKWLKPGGTASIRCREEYCGRLIEDKAYVLNIMLNDASYNSLCRKCVKASCFDGRDFSSCFHIKSGEDRVQSEEILENAKSFLFISDVLYFYRVNDSSITHSISYDGYKADFTVEERSLKLLEKLGLFTEDDYNRFRNFALDSLVMELKRLSRFCSDMENSVMGLDSIRESGYYKAFLSKGYKKAPALPGVIECGGLRRLFNRIAVALLHTGAYRALVYFNKYIYR